MLTNEDITKLIQAFTEVFPTREEVKKDFEDLHKDFSTLQTSVDAMVVIFKKYYEEQQIMAAKINRMEDWIKKASSKLGLDYNS